MSNDQSEVNPASPEVESMNGSFSTNGSDPGAATSTIGSGGGQDLSFLDDLAKAMRSTAAAEQARDAELTDQRRQAHLDAIRARETLEAEDLRELAKEDVKGIDAWSDGEIKRIKLERERRIASRREQLQVRLEEHRLVVGSEVEAVEAAIASYRTDTERFFDRLGSETDPVEIARQAGTRPPFPDLEQIGPGQEAAPVAAYQAPTYEPTAYQPPAYTMTVTSLPAAPVEGDATPATADSVEASGSSTADAPAAAETTSSDDTLDPAATETAAEQESAIADVRQDSNDDHGQPIGVMDPESSESAASTPPWGTPVEAIGEPAAVAEHGDVAVAGVDNGAQASAGSEDPISVGAEARVVMPRTSGTAGSWLRWPNSSVDRSDPSR